MREAFAVTGYIAVEQIDKIHALDQVEVLPERDVTDVVIRVRGSDVEEVRVGGTEAGLTLVQLILRNGAPVETALLANAAPEGLRAFYDPVLNRVRQEATAKKIMV